MSDDQNFRGGQGQVVEAETFRDSVGTMDQAGKRKWYSLENPVADIPITAHL